MLPQPSRQSSYNPAACGTLGRRCYFLESKHSQRQSALHNERQTLHRPNSRLLPSAFRFRTEPSGIAPSSPPSPALSKRRPRSEAARGSDASPPPPLPAQPPAPLPSSCTEEGVHGTVGPPPAAPIPMAGTRRPRGRPPPTPRPQTETAAAARPAPLRRGLRSAARGHADRGAGGASPRLPSFSPYPRAATART